jgi:hypothetical protein
LFPQTVRVALTDFPIFNDLWPELSGKESDELEAGMESDELEAGMESDELEAGMESNEVEAEREVNEAAPCCT